MSNKKTLNKAAGKFALGVTDFFGIKSIPGTEQYRDDPSNEPYWMKDEYWSDINPNSTEMKPSAPPPYPSFEMKSNPSTNPELQPEEFPPPYPIGDMSQFRNNISPISREIPLEKSGIVRGTMRGRGRGRGRGRSSPRGGNAGKGGSAPAKKKPKLAVQTQHKAYFIYLVTIVDTILLIYEIVYNHGFEPFSVNPWIGPSISALVTLGGKFVPRILGEGEWWRFFTAIFLHAGVIHLVVNMLVQIRIGKPLEESYGAWRIAPIYILSGIFGNIMSSIFLPTEVEVGASGALFGFLGVLLSDLLLNWKLLQSPFKNLLILLFTIIIALAIGLLPGIDDFCHIGGLIMGIITSFIFLPNLSYGKCQARWRTVLVCTLIPLVVVLFIVSLVAFYTQVNTNAWCSWCENINCLQIFSWCQTLANEGF
jgi:membrane associated rhomboid family serine protease